LEGSTGLLIFAFFLVMCGAFFSMSETSLMSISKLTVRQMADSGVKRARLIEKILSKKERFISSVLIGNNLVTILVSSMATMFAINISTEYNEALAMTIATVITTIVVVVFGDIIPKVVASNHAQKVALFFARPIALIMFIFTPINAVLDWFIKKLLGLFGGQTQEDEQPLTEQEVLTMLDMGYEAGVIPEEESQMIDAVFEFRKAHARDAMIPRTEMVGIPADAGYDEVVEVFRAEQFTRMPIYQEDMDHIIGILNFKDFMLADIDRLHFDVTKHMREAFFSYELQSTQKLFANMRAKGASMAVILDEYGGCAGLVTIEDIVETIMGEIFDEHDDKPEDIICIIEDSEYRVPGSVRIDMFNKQFDTDFVSDDYDTMAGYVVGLFGYIPDKSEEYVQEAPQGRFTFIVEEVDKNRIESLKVKIEKTETVEV